MLRLAAHRLFPVQAEPGKVLVNRRLELRPAARHVDIFDAQEETPAGRPRRLPADERGCGVSEMEIPRRARREPRDDHGLSDVRIATAWGQKRPCPFGRRAA